MPQEINPWAMYPRKTSTASLPEALQMEVTKKALELIETVLKPKDIQPPPEKRRNLLVCSMQGTGVFISRLWAIPVSGYNCTRT